LLPCPPAGPTFLGTPLGRLALRLHPCRQLAWRLGGFLLFPGLRFRGGARLLLLALELGARLLSLLARPLQRLTHLGELGPRAVDLDDSPPLTAPNAGKLVGQTLASLGF
jgi:hypothetical protein